jgi:hypothetical protein
MSHHMPPTAEELALLKSLPVRPWTPGPDHAVIPAGHANRRAIRAASRRAPRQTKRQRNAR